MVEVENTSETNLRTAAFQRNRILQPTEDLVTAQALFALQPNILPHRNKNAPQRNWHQPKVTALRDCTPPPLPFVQAMVNNQKSTEHIRVLLTRYTVHGTCIKTRCGILKTKGQIYATKAIMPQSASLTQNVIIMYLKRYQTAHIAHSRTN